MFLKRLEKRLGGFSFLRASGGVSYRTVHEKYRTLFSPRKRRCFLAKKVDKEIGKVFSAQAEVFLVAIATVIFVYCFLRASGGVSTGGRI